MRALVALRNRGVAAALGAALLFGASPPVAKLLLPQAGPWILAGLLYIGSGLGLTALLAIESARGRRVVTLSRRDWPWIVLATACGGVLAPVLLLTGLAGSSASTTSLLLNAEGVLTALLAWFVFGENFDRCIAFGMLLIAAGAVLLSWDQGRLAFALPNLLVLGACLAWAADNNLTRRVSHADARLIAAIKGMAAGSVNLALGLAAGASWPSLGVSAAALGLGFLSYGVSLALFVLGLRHLGAARTGAYFSTAPFVGALIAVLLLAEPATLQLAAAGVLMAMGVWLHLTERHLHRHTHEPVAHDHEHEHDVHHRHAHDEVVVDRTRHSHPHRHEALEHTHEHFPDAHHGHRH
jgi:drug/metabolite transporter (DMT)-like permease